MKYPGLLPTLVASTLLASPLHAQDEAEHEALRALRTQLVTALAGTDVDAIADCFAPTFSFTGSDQSIATSRAELEAYYAQWLEGEDAPLERMEITAEADAPTHLTGPDTGFSHGTGVITYHLKAGPVVPIPSRWTASVRKFDGEWKIETVHIGVNILDNPVMKAQVGFWRSATFGAGIGGLLLGVILMRVMRRKKAA